MGNTRTSMAGKDLNRKYAQGVDLVFPEVRALMDYVHKLKEKYAHRLLYVIDIHGHSTRKNSFFFGPEFPIFTD